MGRWIILWVSQRNAYFYGKKQKRQPKEWACNDGFGTAVCACRGKGSFLSKGRTWAHVEGDFVKSIPWYSSGFCDPRSVWGDKEGIRGTALWGRSTWKRATEGNCKWGRRHYCSQYTWFWARWSGSPSGWMQGRGTWRSKWHDLPDSAYKKWCSCRTEKTSIKGKSRLSKGKLEWRREEV